MINNHQTLDQFQSEILLVLLPFWTPYVPPLGIACLKAYLLRYGYKVTNVDANTESKFWDIYHNYVYTLKEAIPIDNRGNFNNLVNDVIRNHESLFVRSNSTFKLNSGVRSIVKNTFFVTLPDNKIDVLNNIIEQYFISLRKYMIDLISKSNPDVIGFSVFSGNFPSVMFGIELIEELFPETRVFLGGGIFSNQLAPGSQNLTNFLNHYPALDLIIVGEGELLTYEYLCGKFKRDQKIVSIEDIGNKTLDLSEFILPDFTDFDLSYYTCLSVFASRSCPYQCKFCSETVQWGHFRKKSVYAVVDELQELSKMYNRQMFLLADSLLNPFINEFSKEMLSRDSSIYWDGYLRADDIICSSENVLLWRKAGLYRVRIGVESGSQKVLDMMDKRISIDQVKTSLKLLASVGIKTTTYWVIGYPGETEEDFNSTLDLLAEMKDYIYEADCNLFSYYPTGQVESSKWSNEFDAKPVYSQITPEVVVDQAWSIETDPSREVAFNRMCRFIKHCKNIGIPNPYTLREFYMADERWKSLHKNSVPSIISFGEGSKLVSECKTFELS